MLNQRIRRVTLNIAVATLLACGAINSTTSIVSAQNRQSDERRLVGSVISVDRNARTMLVREQKTGVAINVFVPKDRQIRLGSQYRPSALPGIVNIESVMRGMIVDLMVTSRKTVETIAAKDR